MDNQDLQDIQDSIGHRFQNPDLLQQAFVRRSYSQENGGENNEILEFIGDKVLDFMVVKLLADKYGFMVSECDDFDANADFDEFACEKNEAQLTELKKQLVQKSTLARHLDRLELADYLIMGKGDIKCNADKEDSVKEDLFEAILGAVAIDCNWNIDTLTEVVGAMLIPESILDVDDESNYVALIEEWFFKQFHTYPPFYYGTTSNLSRQEQYEIRTETYDISLQKCWLEVFDKKFIGSGRTQTIARTNACISLCQYLEQNNLLYTIKDEIENPNKDDAISQLEILARRGYFSIPTYDFLQAYDENGNPIWTVNCHIPEKKKTYSAKASSKKDAKKAAAYKMLKFVLKG